MLKEEITKIVDEVDSSTTMADVDKFHRNGPLIDSTKQDIIVRFKSHAAKEAFYRKRKDVRRGVKIQPSLTRNNRELLESCRNALNDYADDGLENPPDFVMANMHGKIQVKMKKKFGNRLFFDLRSLQNLHEVVDQCNMVNPNPDKRNRTISLGYSEFNDIINNSM